MNSIFTLLAKAFDDATFKASLLISQAVTLVYGNAFLILTAIQPLPVPISKIDNSLVLYFSFNRLIVFSTNSSVSGRGIKTFLFTFMILP